jgi:hypothetical protein
MFEPGAQAYTKRSTGARQPAPGANDRLSAGQSILHPGFAGRRGELNALRR